jgi:AcrR family transcriptional regulator
LQTDRSVSIIVAMKPRRDTRTAIVEAAIVLLGRDGPDRFSASALAREVGISKANLFHHFPNFGEIPLAAFDLLGAAMLAPAGKPPTTARDWLLQLGDTTFKVTREQQGFLRAYFVFFGRALFDERMRKRLEASAEPVLAGMVERLRQFMPRTEAETTARLALMTLDGLGLHLLALGEKRKTRRAWRRFVDALFPEEKQS